jgi:D-alanyl-D-alanine carboxypeptidase (penicillin-binding protein 5/6)
VLAAPYSAIYGESLLELPPGERVSVRDLLYGLILRSGNDAAYVLALAAAGSERAFVEQMNLRAAALGLSNTHYANPIGLDEAGNYSSARDLTALGRRLLRIGAFARIARARRAELRSLRPPRRIATLNDLLLRIPWATGIKTGHTFGAGYVLVGSGRRKGVELVSAVIGTPTETERDLATQRLLEYGFSRYRRAVPIEAGEELAAAEIRYSGGELALRAPRGVAVGVRRDQRLSVSVATPGEVEGPIRRGAALGEATVSVDGIRVARVALRAAHAVPEASVLERARSFAGDNPIAVLLAGFVILMGAVVLRRLSR